MNQTAARRSRNPVESARQSGIDELVFGRLKKLGAQPAPICDDATFVRRAFLDCIGTLPTAEEARAFLADPSKTKRSKLIDLLLQRDEYADYWAMKWGDILRVKSEFPINLWPLAAQTYHRWIWTALRDNRPYDRFARELLTGSGSNFRDPQVNFYRAVQSRDPATLAKAVALTFMGVRAEKWPKARLAGFAAFFAKVGYKGTEEWKEEIVYFDPSKKSPAGFTAKPAFPDETPAKIPADQDPREVVADWLASPRNPWFAKAMANRVWCWFLGRGVVHEPDDARPDNPPSNPALLDYLAQELVQARFDVKHLFRLVMNSRTYQLSSVGGATRPDAFARYPLRRLEAEVLIDAVDQITGSEEEYSSQTPEPYTFVPADQRSINLADGSITSAFLQLFGRPARDTGMDSERDNKPSAAQRLHFLNSSHIRNKIERGPNLASMLKGKTGKAAAEEIYLAVLSRFPTDDELRAIADYTNRAPSKLAAVSDVIWALFNSTEFLYRH